jgi:hypothetical protein
MMDTDKNTTKTIIHYFNTILIVLIFILSVISLFFQKSIYLKPGIDIFMILISALYLIFSVIIAVSGIFYPENPLAVSGKVKKSIFILSIFSLLLSSDKLHGLSALREANSLKSIRRQWNAPVILILGIILMLVEAFTALIITGSNTLILSYVLKALASNPYGKILIALFIGWVVLFLTSSVWFYIDTKENMQISDGIRDDITIHKPDMADNERTMITCSRCGFIFNYSHLEGTCPNCGKHNKVKVNTIPYKNPYKKKTIFVLLKSYGTIIGVFSAILIGSYFLYQMDYGNGLQDLTINNPSFEPPAYSYNIPADANNTNKDSNSKQTDSKGSSFTEEEIQKLLDDIQTDTGIKIQSHRELYSNDQTDASGEKYHKVTILTATEDSDKIYWYQYYKYVTDSENHKAGEIVFYTGMESSTITKSDLTSD